MTMRPLACRLTGMNNETKYTPGPWRVEDDPYGGKALMVVAEQGGMAALLCDPLSPATAIDRANARLISAAPDLLEALREMSNVAAAAIRVLAALGQPALVMWENEVDTAIRDHFYVRAEAAIAKAEG